MSGMSALKPAAAASTCRIPRDLTAKQSRLSPYALKCCAGLTSQCETACSLRRSKLPQENYLDLYSPCGRSYDRKMDGRGIIECMHDLLSRSLPVPMLRTLRSNPRRRIAVV